MPVEKHIRLQKGDVAKYCLIPGDPGRVIRMSKYLDNPQKLAENREYTVYAGEYSGIPVTICSTGIGGPSAAIAVEELARCGGSVFIRVGSAGGRRPNMRIGSVAVVDGGVRDEGTSRAYLPEIYPAIADHAVTSALIEAAKAHDEEYHVGLSISRDAFYRRNETLAEQLKGVSQVAVAEMECSTVFIVAASLGLKCGAIVGTDSNIWLTEQPPQEEKERLFLQAEAKATIIALEAIKILEQSGA